VIWYLREGERCFTELQTDIMGVSAKMLTNRLRKLERDVVIERLTRPTSPPTVWYSLRLSGMSFADSSLMSSISPSGSSGRRSSSQQFFHHVTVYVRQSEVAAGITIGKILMIEAKQPQ